MDILTGAIGVYNDHLDAAIAANPDANWRTSGKPTKANPNGEDVPFFKANAPEWIGNYLKWRRANPHLTVWTLPGTDDVPAIEVDFVAEVDDGLKVRGFIDRVFHNHQENSELIVDLKSGKTAQASPLQLAFYRLGIRERFGVDIRYGAYYDARKGGLDALYDLDQFPPDLILRWVRNMARAVLLNDYTPNVSRDCSWCDVKGHCYVWQPGVERPAGYGVSTPHVAFDLS